MIDGPHEKSRKYENANPLIMEINPTHHAMISLFPHDFENKAENVAGIIKKEKITSTPAIFTEKVITRPNSI